MDAARREIPGGWVAVSGGFVSAVGEPGREPPAEREIDAAGCLVTPGLVNTHHHLYQNLTRAFAPALDGDLFEWLRTLYPVWSRLDEEAAYVSAWIGLCELALGGCTTSTDHLYVHPRGAGDLISAEIAAARELGFRFHPTRGSMSLSVKDGGLPPDAGGAAGRRDPGRQRAAGGAAPRPRARRHGTHRAGAVLAVFGDARADGAYRGTRRASGRAAAHPPGRGHRRERLLRDGLRLPSGRALRAGRLGLGPGLGRALRAPQPGGDRAPGALGHRRGALPELESDSRRRPGAGAGVAGCRRPGGYRLRRLGVGRLRVTLAGDPRRPAAGPAARRAAGDAGARGAGAGDPGRRRLPGAGTTSAAWLRAAPAIWWPGRWPAVRTPRESPSPEPCPTRWRHCCAAGPWCRATRS